MLRASDLLNSSQYLSSSDNNNQASCNNLKDLIRTEFRVNAKLYSRLDVFNIEAALRRGHRFLDNLNSNSVTKVSKMFPNHDN